jgi:hypothetical protein
MELASPSGSASDRHDLLGFQDSECLAKRGTRNSELVHHHLLGGQGVPIRQFAPYELVPERRSHELGDLRSPDRGEHFGVTFVGSHALDLVGFGTVD